MWSGSGVCAFNLHMLSPLNLNAGRRNKKAKVILETFLGRLCSVVHQGDMDPTHRKSLKES